MSRRKGAIGRSAGSAGSAKLPGAAGAVAGVPRSWLLTLAGLLVLRVVLSLLPGMWLWGLNVPRFVPPLFAVGGLGLMALALLPPVGRRLEPALHGLGDLASRVPWAAHLAWVTVAVGSVAALPDRTHFTGDFALRERAVVTGMNPAEFFPQAFRLDVWLHHTLPVKLTLAGIATPNGVARLTGMIDAALLAVVAVELSRMLRLRGVAACFATSAVLFVGGLGCLTGLGKAFSELTVLGAAVAFFGLRIVLLGSGLGLGGVALALALLLHRSAILLIPVLVVPILLALRARRSPAWPEALIGFGAPLAALAYIAGPLIRTAASFDRPSGYFGMPVGVGELALNATDAVNLLLLLVPSMVMALGWRGRIEGNIPNAVVWVAFALPFGLLAVSVRHSSQGLFRDWDMFAAVAAPLGMLAAARGGRQLESLGHREGWIGVAAVAAVVVPSLLWLGSQSDLQSGMRRARAFALETPRRPDDVRGRTWAFIMEQCSERDDYAGVVAAGRMAVALSPTRNVLLSLAGSEKNIGENAAALADFRRMIVLDRSDPVAWYNIAVLAAGLGDFPQAEEALQQLGATKAGAEVLPLATALVVRERQRQIAVPAAPGIAP
jgi:hypothetical protein